MHDEEPDGTHLYRQSAVSNWSAAVPVPESEWHEETADGPEHRGQPFTARTLFVYARGGVAIRVSGPNIKQDGTAGKYTLYHTVTREYAAQEYPRALAGLNTQLGRLAGLIRADADEACKEISLALPG
jgi:hypothetical protein